MSSRLDRWERDPTGSDRGRVHAPRDLDVDRSPSRASGRARVGRGVGDFDSRRRPVRDRGPARGHARASARRVHGSRHRCVLEQPSLARTRAKRRASIRAVPVRWPRRNAHQQIADSSRFRETRRIHDTEAVRYRAPHEPTRRGRGRRLVSCACVAQGSRACARADRSPGRSATRLSSRHAGVARDRRHLGARGPLISAGSAGGASRMGSRSAAPPSFEPERADRRRTATSGSDPHRDRAVGETEYRPPSESVHVTARGPRCTHASSS